MREGKVLEVAPGRRHIIRRPRLTRLLDESASRIILLVAPAGYGKTTLAQEWLSQAERRSAWYRGSPASADVAALAVGLAEAAAAVVPGAGERMRELLRATGQPEQAVQLLAELMAEDLADWPEDAWLAIDDYHFAIESKVAEEFVDLLATNSPVQLLITSRRRPSWASARRILYGELHELGRNALAMSPDEAGKVLSRRKGDEVPGLLALAEGWPAIIGLAALTSDFELPEGDIPAALYDYFAEELYQTAEPKVRWGLSQLAVAPSITTELAEFLLGAEGGTLILQEGLRLGFLGPDAKDPFNLHPLIRNFLERKFRERGTGATTPLINDLGRFLLARQRWDDVFSLAQRYSASDLLVTLLENALQSMLFESRLATLGRWLDYAARQRIESPFLDLAAAELAVRQGQYARAETLAIQASRGMAPGHSMLSQTYSTAGRAAHLNNQEEIALQYYKRSQELAKSNEAVHQAVWGQFISALDLEHADVLRALGDLERLHDDSPESVLRLATARLMMTGRLGQGRNGIESARRAVHLVPKVHDPMIRSAFLNGLVSVLLLEGRYEDALCVVDDEILEIEHSRLTFAIPHAYLAKALAELGMRHFPQAGLALDRIERALCETVDLHAAVASAAVRSRLHLSQGAISQALSVTEVSWEGVPARAMWGEFLATRALALACDAACTEALELVDQADLITRAVEARTLGACVRAIAALKQGTSYADLLVAKSFEVARSNGSIDCFISAYRGCPELLVRLAKHQSHRVRLMNILGRAQDGALAKVAGLSIPGRSRGGADQRLSVRELQVYELLGRGASNKQIANALYISESTVKVHVRHIFEKLGVRSRTEVALRAAAEQKAQAAPATRSLSE